MSIPAMALLQQHDARRDIVIEPAARRRAAIEARGHSELRAFGTGGVRNWGRNRAVKTHRLVPVVLVLPVYMLLVVYTNCSCFLLCFISCCFIGLRDEFQMVSSIQTNSKSAGLQKQ